MPLRPSVRFLESLKRAQEDVRDPSLLADCTSHARIILEQFLPSWISAKDDTISQMNLHFCALAVQFLCLSLVSYCQAHVGAIQLSFLEHDLRSARLNGAPTPNPTQSFPTILVELRMLTSLDSLLGNQVLVFSPVLQSGRNFQPKTGQKYDVVATLENIIDTWGPAGSILSEVNPSEVNPSSRLVSGLVIGRGVIQGINGLWAWSPKIKPQKSRCGCAESLTNEIRIGALEA
ncbi:hypothetical protein M433DRAFT_8501 [Acidomyces richmondensis BFW]|nr:hypothetical protein M433DRAFT_8501 [Acidomyces richmondensis BFW]